MTGWLADMIAKWLLDEIKNGGVESVAKKINAVVIPWLKAQKQAVFRKLKAEAGKTATPIDDAALETLDSLLDYLLPDPGNI